MKKINFLLMLSTFIGCSDNINKKEKMETSEKFEYTTKPQDAVFYIETGWAGGCGSMPIINKQTDRPKEFNGSAIYFDEKFRDQIIKKLPKCVEGTPEIIISGQIQLVEKKCSLSTPESKEMVYYEAKVISLNDIEINATPCTSDSLFNKNKTPEKK